MNQDNSTQSVLFRLRRGIGSNEQTMKSYKNYSLQGYGRPYLPTLGKIPTILGKRNGVPVGADQDHYQQQRNIMNRRTTRPYKSNNLHDILPTIYNGNVNILATTGGAPLAFALDDDSELQERLFSEGIRGSSSNPLSARFAMNARRDREPPVFGGQTDVMRRELAGHEDDEETMGRKLRSGHFGDIRNQSADLRFDTQLDPEVEAFKNQRRPPTKKDFDGYDSRFQATVNQLNGNVVAHLSSLRSQLDRINTKSRLQGTTLSNIYNFMSNYQPAGGGTAASLAAAVPVGSGSPTTPPTHLVSEEVKDWHQH